jgi:hypothetical protein
MSPHLLELHFGFMCEQNNRSIIDRSPGLISCVNRLFQNQGKEEGVVSCASRTTSQRIGSTLKRYQIHHLRMSDSDGASIMMPVSAWKQAGFRSKP